MPLIVKGVRQIGKTKSISAFAEDNYKNDKSTIEMDFFVRNSDSLIPIEVKATDNATKSLNKFVVDDKYADVKYGIKLGLKNIGFNGSFYTFPYFLAFMLKRFLRERGR